MSSSIPLILFSLIMAILRIRSSYTIIYSGLTGSSYYPSIRSFPHSNLVLYHTTCMHSCTLWRYVCPVFVFPILSCTHPECHLLIPSIIIQMISVSYEMIQRSLPLVCKWDQLTSPPTQKIRDETLTVLYFTEWVDISPNCSRSAHISLF